MRPHYDLSAPGGGKTVSITPSAASQNARFLLTGMPSRIRDMWCLAKRFVVAVTVSINQPASGASVIYDDQIYRTIESLRLNCKMFGDLVVQSFTSGVVAKHLMEFVGGGYAYSRPARLVLPTTDQASVCELQIAIPIEQKWNEFPEHFGLWNGWFEGGFLDVTIAPTTAIAAVSTGATSETVSVRAWVEYDPSPELLIPPICHLRKYEMSAVSANRLLLQGMGNDGGLQGTIDGARLVSMYMGMDQLGFGGPDGADNITGLSIPWRDVEDTDNIDAFFSKYFEILQGARGVAGGSVAASDNWDWGTHPYIQSATTNGRLNQSTAFLFPLAAPRRNQLISKLQKVRGNYPINLRFTTTPTSGSHIVYTQELKEFSLAKKGEMLMAAQIDPGSVDLVRKYGRKNVNTPASEKNFCIPEVVRGRQKSK